MNKLLVGWRPYVIAAVVLCALAVAVFAFVVNRHDDRFGDQAELDRINSMNCGELQQEADKALQVMASNPSDEEFDRAVGYSNAANDRMAELGC